MLTKSLEKGDKTKIKNGGIPIPNRHNDTIISSAPASLQPHLYQII
jgi:hypothetical protein